MTLLCIALLLGIFMWVGYLLGRNKMPDERTMIHFLVKERAKRMITAVEAYKLDQELNVEAHDLVTKVMHK